MTPHRTTPDAARRTATTTRLLGCSLVLLVSAAPPVGAQRSPHASEPIGTVRQMYDGALSEDLAVSTFRNIDRLFPTRTIHRSDRPMPLPRATKPFPPICFTDRGTHYDLDSYLAANRVSGILVLADGRIALERYRYGNTARTRWMSMSIAKSVTSTLFGLAIKQGKLALSDSVTQYVPLLAGSAYAGVSVRDLLMMASGVRWNETYTDSSSDRRHLLDAQISQVAGATMDLMRRLPRAHPPGLVSTYSTGETQVAAEVLRAAIREPLAQFLGENIWSRYGMEADANWWLDSRDGVEIGGSGLSATLRDYGRFGLFFLNEGIIDGRSVLPDGWMREASTPKTLKDGTRLDYGYFWWPGTTAAARRDQAFEGSGIFGQHLYINPAARVVIVVWGAQTKPLGGAVVDDWTFFEAVVRALGSPPTGGRVPSRGRVAR